MQCFSWCSSSWFMFKTNLQVHPSGQVLRIHWFLWKFFFFFSDVRCHLVFLVEMNSLRNGIELPAICCILKMFLVLSHNGLALNFFRSVAVHQAAASHLSLKAGSLEGQGISRWSSWSQWGSCYTAGCYAVRCVLSQSSCVFNSYQPSSGERELLLVKSVYINGDLNDLNAGLFFFTAF